MRDSASNLPAGCREHGDRRQFLGRTVNRNARCTGDGLSRNVLMRESATHDLGADAAAAEDVAHASGPPLRGKGLLLGAHHRANTRIERVYFLESAFGAPGAHDFGNRGRRYAMRCIRHCPPKLDRQRIKRRHPLMQIVQLRRESSWRTSVTLHASAPPRRIAGPATIRGSGAGRYRATGADLVDALTGEAEVGGDGLQRVASAAHRDDGAITPGNAAGLSALGEALDVVLSHDDGAGLVHPAVGGDGGRHGAPPLPGASGSSGAANASSGIVMPRCCARRRIGN